MTKKERAVYAAGEFLGASLWCSTQDKAVWNRLERLRSLRPDDYIEYDGDKGGTRAFLLAVAKQAVLLLEGRDGRN